MMIPTFSDAIAKALMIACAALVLALIWLGFAHWRQGEALELTAERLKTEQAEHQVCKMALLGYKAAIDESNRAIEGLMKAGAERAAAADEALAGARRAATTSESARRRLAALLAAPGAATVPATCASAVAAVRKELRP